MTDKTLEQILAELRKIHARKKEKPDMERDHRGRLVYPTLAHYWDDFRSALIPKDAREHQVKAMRIAFMSGALLGFETVRHAFDPLDGMLKDSPEYELKLSKIIRHISRFEDEISDAAAEILAARMSRSESAVHMVVISLSELLEEAVRMHKEEQEKEAEEQAINSMTRDSDTTKGE